MGEVQDARDASGHRSERWDTIAMTVATSTLNLTQLAELFGYSVGGMGMLLKQPHMHQRIEHYRSMLADRVAGAVAKLHLHLDRMLDLDLQIAMPTEESGINFADKKSIDVRHYLMDKVLAAKQVVTNINKSEQSDEARELLTTTRDLLLGLKAAAEKRTTDIQSSPFVLDGDAAVAKAIDITPQEPT